jgi:hypothetical protein
VIYCKKGEQYKRLSKPVGQLLRVDLITSKADLTLTRIHPVKEYEAVPSSEVIPQHFILLGSQVLRLSPIPDRRVKLRVLYYPPAEVM